MCCMVLLLSSVSTGAIKKDFASTDEILAFQKYYWPAPVIARSFVLRQDGYELSVMKLLKYYTTQKRLCPVKIHIAERLPLGGATKLARLRGVCSIL